MAAQDASADPTTVSSDGDRTATPATDLVEANEGSADILAFLDAAVDPDATEDPPELAGDDILEAAEGEEAATEGEKRKRAPITWTLGSSRKGEACDGEAGNEPEEPPGSPKRLRPNPAFLTGLVTGLKRTNERIIADTAANAACQEITAAAANGAKVQFDRVPQDDSAKFKRVALSVAAQQNLASCVAVLKEVAAHYGFTLNIEDDFAPPTAEANGAAAAQRQPGASGLTATSAPALEEGGAPVEEGEPPGRALKPMSVRLTPAESDEAYTHRKRQPLLPDDARLQKPKLPQVAINNRLAGAALSAATGLSQPGITKPKLPPAKGLAMDAATPKAVVQAVTQVQSSVARAAGPSAGSQSRSSTQSGEEAAENVPVLATSGGMRSDHAVAEDAGSKEDLEDPEFGGSLSEPESYLNEDDQQAEPRVTNMQSQQWQEPGVVRTAAASSRVGLRSDIEQRLGNQAGVENGHLGNERRFSEDVGNEKVASAKSRLSSQPRPRKMSGLFGAAMSSIAR